MPITLGELRHDQIPQACELFQQVFGATTTPANWVWKYHQGPRLGSVNLVAQTQQGQLLGHIGASVFPGSIAGTSFAMVQVCDVMVAKSARGGVDSSTVYHRLMQALQQTVSHRFNNPFAYGFAGVRPFRLGERLGFYRECQPCRAGYLDQQQYPPPRWWSVSPVMWDDSRRIDHMWVRYARQGHGYPKVSRTADYLQWRYAAHPQHNYQLWVVKRLLQDQGWFITRTMPNGDTCVVDALLPPQASAPILTAALAQALASEGTLPKPVFSWYLQTPQSQQTEPIIGGEVRIAQWHRHLPNPVFHPGDTDVF